MQSCAYKKKFNSNLKYIQQKKQSQIFPSMILQNTQNLENQVNQICNMCMAMGIHKNIYLGETKQLSHMPVSLYPYEVTEFTYNKLVKANRIWVKLLLKVAKDKEFVNKVFQKTANSDDFVKRFLDIYNKHIDDEVFGVNCIRVDYMGDEHPELVQFNLMSVGLNGMSDTIQKLATIKQKHRQTDCQVYYPVNNNQVNLLNAIQTVLKSEHITGMALMVVHEPNQKQFNFGDQNAFELQALRRQIKVKRVTMSQLINGYRIDESNNFFINEEKVALIYFRTAYSPAHYISEDHWKIREQIQRANILSVPSVSMQLINFKRMQVQLSKIEVLKKFLSEEQAELISSLSGEIYDFQNQNQLEKLLKLSQTGNYILKTNRQGGGNNYFGLDAADIVEKFIKMPRQIQKYVLMKKIKSQTSENIFIQNYKFTKIEQSTCEFSVFSSFAYKNDKLIYNQCGGTSVRLKRAEQNQGGVAIGKAVIGGVCIKKQKIAN